MQLFIEREYPEILKDEHDPIFIPEAYLYETLTKKVLHLLLSLVTKLSLQLSG